MSDKGTKTTKADLLKMLTEAVRNTPGATPIEPVRDAQPELNRKTRPAPKRKAKTRKPRTTASRNQRRR
jgi:hypothetical protein